MNSFFGWLKDSGTQATLVLVGTCAAIIAALAASKALSYAKDAPTKDDLARVEQNTAETAGHIEKVRSHIARVDERQAQQYDTELLRETARHISIHVKGAYGNAGPMTLYFAAEDPNVILLSAQLRNESGSIFGQAPDCILDTQKHFKADYPFDDIRRWYDSATKIDMRGRRVLTIRAHLKFGQQYLERDIPTWVERSAFPAFTVEGCC